MLFYIMLVLLVLLMVVVFVMFLVFFVFVFVCDVLFLFVFNNFVFVVGEKL